MKTTEAIVPINNFPAPTAKILRRIRFVENAAEGKEAILAFSDPTPRLAVCFDNGQGTPDTGYGAPAADGIDVLTMTESPKDQTVRNDELLKWVAEPALPGAAPPIVITVHGAQIIWGFGRAAVLAAPDRVEMYFLATVEFCYYENELRKLECETADGWAALQADTPLAHDVSRYDAERFEAIAVRTEQTLGRRIRLARLSPHLSRARTHLSPLANQLTERLREKTSVEERIESLGGQLDVCERILECSSQRISDYKSARQSHILEWVIIVLLATETLLLLISVLSTLGI
jgi:hypothetical protein